MLTECNEQLLVHFVCLVVPFKLLYLFESYANCFKQIKRKKCPVCDGGKARATIGDDVMMTRLIVDVDDRCKSSQPGGVHQQAK